MVIKYVDHTSPGGGWPLQLFENRGNSSSFKRSSSGGRGHEVYNAAKDGRDDTLYTLLGDGCDVKWVDASTGATPAYIAAANGHAECLRLLLSHGALVDARTNAGRTGLIAAASGGHAACVSQLLAVGADRVLPHRHAQVSPLGGSRSERRARGRTAEPEN